MENLFDINKYQNIARNNPVEIISYPQCNCPASHPINLGNLNNFDNGQLNFCGKICK